MKLTRRTLLAAPLGLPALAAGSQLPLTRGPFEPTVASLETFQVPDWFREA
jgi:alpha-L-fucosidase